MSKRVKHLRRDSIETVPYISTERAELLTDFYKSGKADTLSTPVARASAFRHILLNKEVYIGDNELIVGERGPSPRATPTYPELCCHSIADLETCHSRARSRFIVNEDTKETYQDEIIPFWRGRAMREQVFASVSDDWMRAFETGVFTEFMEQRAPGHAILDDKIYRRGVREIIQDIDERLLKIDFYRDPDAYTKDQNLRAMRIAAEAIIEFAQRYADKAMEMAEKEPNPEREKELKRIADVCNHVPANASRTFWEALQSYWFIHLGVITELNVWDSFNPGRLDQHLCSFYEKELQTGELTRDFAKELLECFWIKVHNQPAPPKVDITEEQSGTYQDFTLINTGGLTVDGENAVNDVSYLLLEVCEEMQLMMPSLCVQVSEQTPDDFLLRTTEVVATGFGQPSIFNTDVIIEEFLRMGKSIEDARCGGPSGCVTIGAFGKESVILTGYMNLPKILELTLNNGIDPLTKKQVGIESGNPLDFESFDELFDAFSQQLEHFVNLKIQGNNIIERLYAMYMPSPFMSILMDDCIKRAKDYHDGGSRYNSTYIQGVGIGTITDCLSAIKHHVFDKKSLSIAALLTALKDDFEGHETLQQMLMNRTPTYGNDDDFADSLAMAVFDDYFNNLDGRPNTKGGEYRMNLLPTTVHIYFGQVTGATPNGRRAGQPLSDGISPSHGVDIKGPTAVIKSASKIDHRRTGGTLLNQKLMPDLLADNEGRMNLVYLIRTYFKLGGHHIQFNVVDRETLLNAQNHPELYGDLIVRVAGYSDYFVNLGKPLQDEIIARTEQKFL
ncbi:MAG: glycyl radical protein [Candidatus Thorarchaeota archaeon]|nr:glycyl radical protein [Candidatus Thorarchaeota archaeon]